MWSFVYLAKLPFVGLQPFWIQHQINSFQGSSLDDFLERMRERTESLRGGWHSTEVAFTLLALPARVRFSASAFPRKILDVAARLIDSEKDEH